MYLIIIVLALCTVWGAVVGKHRGRTVLGAVLGFVLGFIGVGITALLKPTQQYLIEQEQERLRIQALASSSSYPPLPPSF